MSSGFAYQSGDCGILAGMSWSETAQTIAREKYFARRKGQFVETTTTQMITRITETLFQHAERVGFWRSNSERRAACDRLFRLFQTQAAAFNSPVWFNLGLKEKYGWSAEGDVYKFNALTNSVDHGHDPLAWPQVSACFIQSVGDDLNSIYDLLKNEAKLFKYGSGSGTNFSSLRPRDQLLSGGEHAAGLIGFLRVFDTSAGTIKSGGITRRAAKMVCVDVDHPEILDFVQWKTHEENKARALIAAGFEGGFEGDAYRTVSGQNANNSVRVSDAFMKAIATDGLAGQGIPARKIWQAILSSAWHCADPGIQFHDTINRWHTCPQAGAIRASNPCSEYMFLDDSACNLASLNLVKFQTRTGDLDIPALLIAVDTVTRFQDLLVEVAGYPTAKIAENSWKYRPLGLGFANLGAFIMRQGLAYDSDAARALASQVTSLIQAQALKTSAELAEERGPLHDWRTHGPDMLDVISRMKTEAVRLAPGTEPHWQEALQLGEKYGFRNAQSTAIAPTGTIGLLMDCDTLGIEPEFALTKIKSLAGGGSFTFVNQSITPTLTRLGYDTHSIEKIILHLQQTGSLQDTALLKTAHRSIFDCALPGSTGVAIAPDGHLKMMAAVQPLVSGAISKTVNLPTETTEAEIGTIYEKAFALGLKSVAIYRDKSKGVQVLTEHPGLPIDAPLCRTPGGCD